MDPVRWERLEKLCFDALELPRAERAAFLDRECDADDALRGEAESLLSHLEADPSFLERPIVDRGDVPSPAVRNEPLPAAIGPYRPVRRLGRGGMGDVYLAMQEVEDVRQSVALKVIRRGRDTDDVLRHFRLERRILAGLGHPNIARLVDAGATEDGRPYFVMEYVEGRPIDAYCDAQRLSVDARLELFQVICGAVQHAHQKLVVHRDIKPGNILVDDAGVPKLLDFGIGKVLDETGAFGTAVETRTEIRLLTPAHAAPEQIRGEPVTTATDVYALGVLLYQLLSGRHPYVSGGETVAEIERAVLETSPLPPSAALDGPTRVSSADARPGRPTAVEIGWRRGVETSQLRRRLAGDLDNIVLAAMRKEPERRYASAAALADDVRRHLAGRPVSARPDTFVYRASKFVRRNGARVAAAAVTLVALGMTTTVTLVQSRRVAREAELVTRERDKALEVRGFLMEMFGATGADRAVGDSVTARRLLDLQAASLDEAYRDRPELRAEMLEVLADGYDRLGLLDAAEPLAREALALRRRTAGPRHVDVAASLNLLGWILHEKGGSADAEPLLREAVAIRRAAGPRYALDLARSLNDLGVVLTPLGQHAEAETVLDEALAIRRSSLGEAHRSVGITASNLAVVYFHRGKVDDAIPVQELAVRALLESVGADHQRSVIALGNLAAFRHTLGDWVGAEREYRELLERQIRLRGRMDPQTANVMRSLGFVLHYRASDMSVGATSLDETADALLSEAERHLREALTIFETRLGSSHPEVGHSLEGLRAVLVSRGRLTDALPVQERAVRIFRSAFGDANATTAVALSGLASIHWGLDEPAEAVTLQRQALATLEETAGPAHPEAAKSRSALCHWLLLGFESASEALPFCAEAERDLRAAPAAYQGSLTLLRLRLAQAHLKAGNDGVADSLLADIAPAVNAGDGGDRARTLFDSLTAASNRGN